MRSRTILILGAAVALTGATAPAMASGEAAAASAALPVLGQGYPAGGMGAHAPRPGGSWNGGMHPTPRPGGSWNGGAHGGPRPGGSWNGGHRWGSRPNGRWQGGWGAPGGWGGYRRPVYGYVLPSYWVQPSYYISNYSTYGFPAPQPGYGWSRYYDDAVMTDRYGRVYDSRSNVDWDRYDGGYDDSDGYYDDRSYGREDTGVGGAAIGAVVGAIAGNRIAGRGDRTAGTLIGAGVGAVAGYAIDKNEDNGRRRAAPPPRGGPAYGAGYDTGYGYADDGVTTNNDYEGRWVGTWYGKDGTTYSGAYEGGFSGNVSGGYGVDYDAPAYDRRPHWSNGPAQPGPAPMAGGYAAGGYYYPAPTVTTVVVQPATTTTTTYVTEEVTYRTPVRRRVKARRTCTCK